MPRRPLVISSPAWSATQRGHETSRLANRCDGVGPARNNACTRVRRTKCRLIPCARHGHRSQLELSPVGIGYLLGRAHDTWRDRRRRVRPDFFRCFDCDGVNNLVQSVELGSCDFYDSPALFTVPLTLAVCWVVSRSKSETKSGESSNVHGYTNKFFPSLQPLAPRFAGAWNALLKSHSSRPGKRRPIRLDQHSSALRKSVSRPAAIVGGPDRVYAGLHG